MRVERLAFLTTLWFLVACQGTGDTTAVSQPTSLRSAADAEEPASAPDATGATATGTAEPGGSPAATDTVGPSDSPTPQRATATPEATGAGEGNADVVFVRAEQEADGTWAFDVTVEHPDTGWEDYADGWDVVTLDGRVLKADPDDPFTRLLLHPHVDEQPFTRSQNGLTIPQGVTQVTVRAHDIVDGYGGEEVTVDLSAADGPNFEVERQP